MTSEPMIVRPMVSVEATPEYRILIDEACGIAHERQILTVPLPSRAVSDGFLLGVRDGESGRVFPIQPSRAEPGMGFLPIEIEPGERLDLRWVPGGVLRSEVAPVSIARQEDGGYLAANTRWAVRFAGSGDASGLPEGGFPPGPIRAVRLLPDGPWRGASHFDTRKPVCRWETEIIEEGPLRVVLRCRVTFGNASAALVPTYEMTLTIDASSDFARVAERWEGNTPGDQIVYDFAGDDLPADILRLNSTAGCAREPLQYLFDRRVCRLFAWTQQSQLSDLSDGYALTFPGGDAVGFVTLDGGDWRGGRLNHMEAWTRRWVGDDPASRRGVPDEAKRDVNPAPERVPARGECRTTPHLCVEGWIGEAGARTWALAVAKTDDLLPGAGASREFSLEPGCSVAARHFENTPDRARDRRESSRLRRIHTQRGLLPLSTLARATFRWLEEAAPSSGFVYPCPVLEVQMRSRERDAPPDATSELREQRRKKEMFDSLRARVWGFWEGGGSAATNPVVSRDIAPRMLQFEYLARTGLLTAEERARARALFAFLIYLFGSDNYYPGAATMLPVEDTNSFEPTIEGMANQNFYTDCVNIPGMGAQVFSGHPSADAWRERFGAHWARQLAYHVYPESGVWEESHTYFQHVLLTVLPTLLRRRDDGVGDGFADPALHKVLRGALRQISPRDTRLGGVRYLVPFGDHSAAHHTFESLYHPYAEAVAPHHPELAAQLSWFSGEMSHRTEVDAAPPPLVSEYVQGLGYFLRGVDADGDEFLLALRAGSAWGHHHHDEGSLQFWAKSRSLIVDAGFAESRVGDRKFSDAGHSRLALTDYPALNFLSRFNRGWIVTHEETTPFPYAVAHVPTFLQTPSPLTRCPLPRNASAAQRRAIVQIGPCAFLVVDVVETGMAQTVRFHIPAMGTAQIDGGLAATDADKCRLTIRAILPNQKPLAITASDTLKDGTTVELAASVAVTGGRSRAVYLIAVDAAAVSLPSVTPIPDSDDLLLTGPGFAVRLAFAEPYALRLSDEQRVGQERIIDLSPPERYLG